MDAMHNFTRIAPGDTGNFGGDADFGADGDGPASRDGEVAGLAAHRLRLKQRGEIEATVKRAEAAKAKRRRRQERALAAAAPHEKLAITRQQRALRRWEDQQRAWDAFQDRMARRMGKRVEDLVFSRSDAWRERAEASTLMAAAVPLDQRHGSAYWLMTLRGEGTRYVRVGNALTGLYCPIHADEGLAPPEIVRKARIRRRDADADATVRDQLAPKPPDGPTAAQLRPSRAQQQQQQQRSAHGPAEGTSSSPGRGRTWSDNPFFIRRQRQLRRNLRRLRAHDPAREETSGIRVVGQDLFAWARASAEVFFDEEERFEKGDASGPSPHGGARGPEAFTGPEVKEAEEGQCGEGQHHEEEEEEEEEEEGRGPLMRALSLQGDATVDAISPADQHPLRVLFETRAGVPTQSAARLRNSGSTVLFFKWHRRAPVRRLLPGRLRGAGGGGGGGDSPFFLSQEEGALLPGDTVDAVFTFASERAGVFRETWDLLTSPPANGWGELEVSLRGVAVATDEASAIREAVDERVRKAAETSGVREIVDAVVRAVRTPTPEPTEGERMEMERQLFEAQNGDRGLLYDPDRFAEAQAVAEEVTGVLAFPEPERAWDGRLATLEELADSLGPDTVPPPDSVLAPPAERTERWHAFAAPKPAPVEEGEEEGDKAEEGGGESAPPPLGYADRVRVRAQLIGDVCHQRSAWQSPLYGLARDALVSAAEEVAIRAPGLREEGQQAARDPPFSEPLDMRSEVWDAWRARQLRDVMDEVTRLEGAGEEAGEDAGKKGGKRPPSKKGSKRPASKKGGKGDGDDEEVKERRRAYLSSLRDCAREALGRAAVGVEEGAQRLDREVRAAELASKGMLLAEKRTWTAEGVAGKHVLLRADLDVPCTSAGVPDDARAPVDDAGATVKQLLEAGATGVVVVGHRGGLDQGEGSALSMEPLAEVMEDAVGEAVVFVGHGPDEEAALDAIDAAEREGRGRVFLLENLRGRWEEAAEQAMWRQAASEALRARLQERRRQQEKAERVARGEDGASDSDSEDEFWRGDAGPQGERSRVLEERRARREACQPQPVVLPEAVVRFRAALRALADVIVVDAPDATDARCSSVGGVAGAVTAHPGTREEARARRQTRRAARRRQRARGELVEGEGEDDSGSEGDGEEGAEEEQGQEAGEAEKEEQKGEEKADARRPSAGSSDEEEEEEDEDEEEATKREQLARRAARRRASPDVVVGPRLSRALSCLASVMEAPRRPVGAVLGGSARAHRWRLLHSLVQTCDVVVVGGELGLALQAATDRMPGGMSGAGASLSRLAPTPLVATARAVDLAARRAGTLLLLPLDYVVGSERPEVPHLLRDAEEEAEMRRIQFAVREPTAEEEREEDASEGGGGAGVDVWVPDEMAYAGDADEVMVVSPAEARRLSRIGAEGEGAEGVHSGEEEKAGQDEEQGEKEDEEEEVSGPRPVPDGWFALDVGPRTQAAMQHWLKPCASVVWSGVMGVVEVGDFQEGTQAALRAIASAKERGAVTLAAGPTTARWAARLDAHQSFDFVGGGHAFVRALSGEPLPGLVALPDAPAVAQHEPAPDAAEEGEAACGDE